MTRIMFALAFVLGAAAVVWIGSGFLGTNTLALAVTLIIGAAYAIGFVELTGFRRATGRLFDLLDSLPDSREALTSWLGQLPPALQPAARRRIEGEPVALPGPMLTPYLLGLLVMLGLLGTFVGMIVTLNGAASALEGSTELATIRSALAAPIAGLSLAFGTSIAGVAASAMLGLAATVSRRERVMVSRQLDIRVRQQLHHLSLDYQREQAFLAIREQSRALPEVVSSLQAMTTHLEQLGAQLSASLSHNQQDFHQQVSRQYETLAESVARSLQTSLADSSRLAAEALRPVVDQATNELHDGAEQSRQQLGEMLEQHARGLAEQFRQTTEQAAHSWQSGLNSHQQASAALAREIAASLQACNDTYRHHTEQLQASQLTGIADLQTTLREQLTALRDQEAGRSETAAQHLAELEATVARHLQTLGHGLEAPMSRLIEAAAEAPKAAAEVIGEMRAELTRSSERDNELLDERRRIMAELNALLQDQRAATKSQQEAIEELIVAATEALTGASDSFASQVQQQGTQLSGIATHISGSADELASLSEALQLAASLFSDSNNQLIGSLEKVEAALDTSASRNNEQLAYYVEQAREIIELSMTSQKDVIDALGAVAAKQSAEEVG
ncbi:DUF802 domain-containing protein [Marinobacter sp.]|uniref:DUF802 domain-containing protein n=1 Tax=Marinobacter sp. TaxID=50741 RepID=UPI00198C68D6|nr:DUF802 domain-containing protein [Marinobacter sp.]MBD3656731.1 DUF802 domain-containing protein [Marinobacter sp.]